MKIVVISDTHGDLEGIKKVLLAEPQADLYLHAGDVCLPKEEIWPFLGVLGNCDGAFRQDYPFKYEIATPFGKLHMEHYPLYSEAMEEYLRLDGVRIFIHGHTHTKEEELHKGLWVYCPGSIAYSEESEQGTYLVLEVSKETVKSTFKEVPR
jgi:putative phosphoesterase